jgi:hypothetical protein
MSRVRVQVPIDSTLLITASGEHVNVQVDETGRRWADLWAEDAALLINSGLADCIPWRELNPHLVGGAA